MTEQNYRGGAQNMKNNTRQYSLLLDYKALWLASWRRPWHIALWQTTT